MSQKNVPMQLRYNDQHPLKLSLASLKYAGDKSFQQETPMLHNALPDIVKLTFL